MSLTTSARAVPLVGRAPRRAGRVADPAAVPAPGPSSALRPATRAAIMAHTDATGDPEANRTPSRERAEAVVDHLVSPGIDADRLRAEGYGDSLPRAQGVTEADLASNRRVEIRVLRRGVATASIRHRPGGRLRSVDQ